MSIPTTFGTICNDQGKSDPLEGWYLGDFRISRKGGKSQRKKVLLQKRDNGKAESGDLLETSRHSLSGKRAVGLPSAGRYAILVARGFNPGLKNEQGVSTSAQKYGEDEKVNAEEKQEVGRIGISNAEHRMMNIELQIHKKPGQDLLPGFLSF